jgi:ABC-type Na+ efflux pump permease subunit
MKKTNTNKFIVTVIALLIVIGGYFAISNFMGGQKGSKAIYITVKDDSTEKTILDKKKFKTDAKNLGDFLVQNKEELQAEVQTSEYGRFVVGLKGVKTTDMITGPWWMYSYKSPAQNLDMKLGEAPGVDQIGLFDNDEIEFIFTQDTGL